MKLITLTKGKFAQVDDELFDQLNRFKWCAEKSYKTFYAARAIRMQTGRQKTIKMHRYIFELKGLSVSGTVDHRDRNGLNNQWENLRPATSIEQARNHGKQRNNSSGYIGVNWDKCSSKWRAQVHVDGKNRHLGLFIDPYSAAWVRDAFVKQHYGEFAVLNNLVDRRNVRMAI